MKLTNAFTIDRPVGEVYDAFLAVERIATCMPGSRLIGQPEPGVYEGEVKVKVGPLAVAYTGRFTILEADAEQRRLTMRAKGREQRGAGNADAHIVATLAEQNGGTTVTIDTDLNVRGKVAQFGRGVIGEVTDGIMQTFAQNVEQMLATGAPAGAAAGAATAASDGAPAGSAAGSGAGSAGGSAAGGEQAAPTSAGIGSGDAAQPAGDLDAWALIVRPMLQRHAGSIATVALAGLAAYLGARAGARAGARSHALAELAALRAHAHHDLR